MDKLSLKNKDWKDFYLSDFFDFEKGNQNNMASLTTGTLSIGSLHSGIRKTLTGTVRSDKVLQH